MATESEDLIKQTVLNENVTNENLMDEWNKRHPMMDNKNQAYEDSLLRDELRHRDRTSTPLMGRMSPVAKEDLYRSYQSGATIKDLSLKYGIFPERVKAIIY